MHPYEAAVQLSSVSASESLAGDDSLRSKSVAVFDAQEIQRAAGGDASRDWLPFSTRSRQEARSGDDRVFAGRALDLTDRRIRPRLPDGLLVGRRGRVEIAVRRRGRADRRIESRVARERPQVAACATSREIAQQRRHRVGVRRDRAVDAVERHVERLIERAAGPLAEDGDRAPLAADPARRRPLPTNRRSSRTRRSAGRRGACAASAAG